MQAVGKFDEYGTDVVLQGFKELPEIAFLLAAVVADILAFCHHIDKESDIGPEALADFLDTVWRVFHHIVQESGNDGIGA